MWSQRHLGGEGQSLGTCTAAGCSSSHMGTLGAAGTPPCPRAMPCHSRPTELALGPGPELQFALGNMELCCH